MALQIAEVDVLAKFDRLVASKELFWQPSSPFIHTEGPLTYLVYIAPTLNLKPIFSTSPPSTSASPSIPLFNDPSPDFRLAHLPPSHTLILNKYSVLRPQYLLIRNPSPPSSATHLDTPSDVPSQSLPLDVPDFAAAWSVLAALEAPSNTVEKPPIPLPQRWCIMYNCGEPAGASRSHKHLQLLPVPTVSGWEMWPDDTSPSASCTIPFTYALSRDVPPLHPLSVVLAEVGGRLFALYERLLGEVDGVGMSHNVVLTRGWMLVVPRRKKGVKGCVTGATGVVGMVWVGGEGEWETWRREAVGRVLGECAVGREA